MQSSGTSTPAGDSPGPGRAFLRTTDFTPEIVPPRLRRTTYPAGQSPLVLPGLTRASSSFTITSNHQNILPLWPAAPPPGQPVVFFCPLSGVRPACFPSARRHGLPRGREGRSRPVPWSMRSALPDTRQGRGIFPFQVPVFEGAAALGHQGRTAFVCGALRCARCPAGFGRPGVAALLRPYAHRSWPGFSCSPAITDGTAHVCSRKFAVPLFLTLLSYHGDAVRCPPAVRQGSGKAHTGASPAAIRRHKKRRPPAWRPADVWSRFTDAARGIRTVCRAGKRWPRNRRPARRHCSTGHGSGSWPGSCARRTWA
jgi:hypothetical protein